MYDVIFIRLKQNLSIVLEKYQLQYTYFRSRISLDQTYIYLLLLLQAKIALCAILACGIGSDRKLCSNIILQQYLFCGGPASPVRLSPAHRCRMRRRPVRLASPANVNNSRCRISYMGN